MFRYACGKLKITNARVITIHQCTHIRVNLCRARVRKADAAVKVVKGGGEREQARLLHEIKVLEQCHSPHIVQFYGYV